MNLDSIYFYLLLLAFGLFPLIPELVYYIFKIRKSATKGYSTLWWEMLKFISGIASGILVLYFFYSFIPETVAILSLGILILFVIVSFKRLRSSRVVHASEKSIRNNKTI